MGILAKLFGLSQQQQVPVVVSVVPEIAKTQILSGKLPVFTTKTIMLNKNETCHYIDKAVMAIKETKRAYQTRRTSSSVRVLKGWTINTGGGRATPDEFEVMKYYTGVLYVTNERIIFSSQDKAFEKKLKSLTAIIPYSDAIGLQCGDNMYNFLLDRVELCAAVINLVRK